MQYAERIAEKIAGLPCDQQAEILRYVEAVAGKPSSREPYSVEQTGIILRQAWGSWGRMSREEIDHTLADMREAWERDLPWPGTEA